MAQLLAALVAAALAMHVRAHTSACEKLDIMFAHEGPRRNLSVQGRSVPLRVYWDGSTPSHAAAALLAAALRHVARYAHVSVERATFCDLSDTLLPLDSDHIEQVALIPASAWGDNEAACATGGSATRLRAVGRGAAPARLALHALLAPTASPACQDQVRWLFYSSKETLINCSFIDATNATSLNAIEYYYRRELEKTALQVEQHAARAGKLLRPVVLRDRRTLLAAPRARSALLLDYDMWGDLPHVRPVEPPPGPPIQLEPHTLRAADDNILRTVAPGVLRLFYKYRLEPQELREVLESEADMDEAACDWVATSSNLKIWAKFSLNRAHDVYESIIFICQDDPDRDEYINVTAIILRNISLSFYIRYYKVDCEDEHALMTQLAKLTQHAYWARLVGVLGAGAGARAAASAANALDTALVVYDVPAATLAPAARTSSGSLEHLALALRHFVSAFGWSRLIVLSESTRLAAGLVDHLRCLGSLKLKEITMEPIDSALKHVNEIGGRVIFVNTNSAIATSVLCVAHELGMTLEAGYVWILREWYTMDIKCANMSVEGERLAHFTVSFWQRGPIEKRVSSEPEDQEAVAPKLAQLWEGRAWPLRAVPLADALLLLLHSFQEFLKSHPQRQTDLHGGNATGLLWENVEESSVQGVTQKLIFNKNGLKSPLVFVDQWYGRKRKQIAIWQIYNGIVQEHSTTDRIFIGKTPSDGSISCITPPAGDEFSPVCLDNIVWTAIAAVLLALPALHVTRRARRSRLERRDHERAARLLARGERATAALAPHLIDRAHLEVRYELGSGRFKMVRFATLRKPGSASFVDVAVKALRDEVSPAEERDFLNEACMLASLRHDNVIRLVGVCAVGGPPLLLMEHAFFGDLQRYLNERRHLASDSGECASAEARHVAAPALTRLGRDAAAALEYLAEQRVVHRDVRACNCLVDARRTLKLGDFGMARRAGVGTDGEAEYACRRRGLFPISWMAPESLERGVFTAASDAWSLGVLLLELVTLGARPYSSWSPDRVMRFVIAGGCPPLPGDVHPDTRDVLTGCWRRAPDERPTAAALRTQLDQHTTLLRPALAPAAETDVTTLDLER